MLGKPPSVIHDNFESLLSLTTDRSIEASSVSEIGDVECYPTSVGYNVSTAGISEAIIIDGKTRSRKVNRALLSLKYKLLNRRKPVLTSCMGLFAFLVLGNILFLFPKRQLPRFNDLPRVLENISVLRPTSVQQVIPNEYRSTVFAGHRSADVDSVCSAIGIAHLFGGTPAMSPGLYTQDVIYAMRKFNLKLPILTNCTTLEQKNWFLVDHSQVGKVPEGVDINQIVGFVDHHPLLADAVVLSQPGYAVMHPWGSTCTIVTSMYIDYGVTIPKDIAGCLLSGIVSDTIHFSSPTTHERDLALAEVVESIAGINASLLANELFKAKSDLSNFSAQDIVQMDMKRYNGKNVTYAVAVVETLRPIELLVRKDELLDAVRELKNSEGLDYVIFVIVDLVLLQSHIFAISIYEKYLIEKAFSIKIGVHMGDPYTLKVVSRKKQIIPALERGLL
eukprot:CFRG7556T1